MTKFTIHLSKSDDGSVAVSVDNGTALPEHVAVAEQVTSVRRSVSALMEGFESGHRPITDPVALAGLGRQLRDVFLAPFAEAINSTAAKGTVRLLFTSAHPECLNLPWELLPGPDGQFLIANKCCAIRRTSRTEGLTASSLPLAAPPLRILFTACAPTDLPGLDYEKEEEAILRIAQKLGGKVHLEIAEAGTFDELRELIVEHRPHIVHLSGHGSVRDGIGSFAFENERGRTDSRDAHEIAAQLFAGQGVRLVFVNGCQTAQAAVAGVCQTLTAGGYVPLALGWGASIGDSLATEFARIFYHEVAAGHPVNHAVARARIELLARCRIRSGQVDLLDASFALPQLHAADDADALFDPRLPPDPPERPGVAYTLLGDNIRGLREGFVGRRRQLQRTRPALRSGEKNIVLLTGIGGAGKSTLATRLANRCAREGYRVVAVQARRENAGRFYLRMLTEIANACQRLGRPSDEAMLQDGNRPIENRLRLAVEILNEARILLVLDNLESLLPFPPATPVWEQPETLLFFSTLLSRLTGQGRAILTCRYLPEGFDSAQPNLAHEVMPDFTEADFFKYLRRHPQVAGRMERGELPRDLIETFHRKLGATPRYVEQACSVLGALDVDRLAEQLDSLDDPAESTAGDDLWNLQQSYFRDLFLPQLFDTLTPTHRVALCRLALVSLALPPDGVERVTGQEVPATADFVIRCAGLSLLQRFGESDEAKLYAVYPLQREFFAGSAHLSGNDRREAHLAAAKFFRECFEEYRENEIKITFMAGLLACLHHAMEAGDLALRIWAVEKLAWPLINRAEYSNALSFAEPLLAESRHPGLLRIVGRCAFDTGEWPKARELRLECLREYQAIGDRAGEAATWHGLASIDFIEGSYTAARESFGKALAMMLAIGDRAGEATAWHSLATIDLNEGSYTAAREHFGKALAVLQTIGDRAGEAATWHQLATIDLNEGSYTAAREHFGKALSMQQAIGNRAGEAATWHQLATIDLNEGSYTAAREHFGKSLAIKQAIGDRAGEAATWNNLGTIDLNEGSYTAAREHFGKALSMRQTIGDRAGEAATWHQLATIDLNEGSYAAAREHFGKSLAIKQAIGDRAGEAATWHQLASIDLNEGSYTAAREHFGKALSMMQAIGDRAGEAATWHQLASIDLNEGSYAAAREHFGKSLAIKQAIGDRAGEAATWHQLANIDLDEGSYAAAREHFGKALAIKQAIGDRAGEAAAWHGLASIDLDEGSYAAAREHFGKSLTMRQAIGDRVGEAATWHQLASIDLDEGSYVAAREHFGKSLTMRQAIGDRAGEAATLNQIGFTAWETGRRKTGIRLVGICYLIQLEIGLRIFRQTLQRSLLPMAAVLELSQDSLVALLHECAETYQRDRGAELVRQAFEGL